MNRSSVESALGALLGSVGKAEKNEWDKSDPYKANSDLFRAQYALASARGQRSQLEFRQRIVQAWIFGYRIAKIAGRLQDDAQALARYALVMAGAHGDEVMISDVYSKIGSKVGDRHRVAALHSEIKDEAADFEGLVHVLTEIFPRGAS